MSLKTNPNTQRKNYIRYQKLSESCDILTFCTLCCCIDCTKIKVSSSTVSSNCHHVLIIYTWK